MSRLFSSQKKILNCSISHCCILNQNMVWKKGNHQTEPITYWLLPPPLAPKYLRCFCDSTLKFFPNSKKVTFSKGEVWEWSWSSFTVPMCPRTPAVRRNAASLSQPSPYSQQFTCNILNMWCMTQRASNLTFNRLEPCGKTLLYLGCDISWHTPSPWKAPDSWFISVTLGLK